MGLFDRFRKVQSTQGSLAYSTGEYPGAYQLSAEAYEQIMGLSPAEMWRTQPYLRTVVTFLARNIAQLGLHTYQRNGEDDRQRIRDGVAEVLRKPNQTTTSFELVYGLVADLALYDHAYWLIAPDPERRLVRLPVDWVKPRGGDATGPEWYEVKRDDRGQAVRIPAETVLAFHGWHPSGLALGSSPVHALRELLAEQVQAAKYREMVWRRGGKVGSVLSRPAGAPDWSDAARSQFKKDWESRFTGTGSGVGGTPMLEDGMTLTRVDFSAHEMEFMDGARLALNTVASVYHINPTMIGLLDNANYSNVREFRRMLYGDTLGPILAMIEDRLNTFLVPLLDSRPDLYVEFNIEEKLQGSFEEQTAALQSSVGRAWMTANEARALRNMPAIEGGDELVTPLNVLVGGQASPTDATPDTLPSAASTEGHRKAQLYLLKGAPTAEHVVEVQRVLTRFFERQSAVVLSTLGSDKAGRRLAKSDWWDGDRWNRELAKELTDVTTQVSASIGREETRRLGYDPSDYDPDATVAYLSASSERYAETINGTTAAQLEASVIAEDGPPPADVFATARTSRASGIAQQISTYVGGFSSVEAGQQLARKRGVEPTKTWVAGANPRPEHAALDGVTVDVDADFPNGSPWPGAGGADDAGCNCSVVINA